MLLGCYLPLITIQIDRNLAVNETSLVQSLYILKITKFRLNEIVLSTSIRDIINKLYH